MTERDYSSMSPQELNAQLKILFETLPNIVTDVDQDTKPADEDVELLESLDFSLYEMFGHLDYRDIKAFASIVRRKRSDMTDGLRKKFRELISVSHLVPSLQGLLARDFVRLTILGADESVEKSFNVLDLESANGGIYDPGEAEEISRKLIRREVEDGIGATKLAKHLWPEDYAVEETGLIAESLANSLAKMIHEFREKYGDEP